MPILLCVRIVTLKDCFRKYLLNFSMIVLPILLTAGV